MEQLANLVAIAFVLHFLWSYYWNCLRKGYRLDLWHVSLLMNLFVIHVMLPFDRSDLNLLAFGPIFLRRAQAHMTEAYFVSAFGYLCILLGGDLWRVRLNLGIRREFARILEVPARLSLLLLQSKSILLLHGIIASTLISGILLYYFKTAGFGFNLRGLLLVNPVLRSAANFASFYGILIGSYCAARFFRYREPSMLLITGVISVGFLFFGSRAPVVGIFTLAIIIYLIELRLRLKLIWIGGVIVLALTASVLLDALRSPHFSLTRVFGTFVISTFYGNSYSDTRDFALILSFWDRHLFWGKTYLAGLIAFVPRFLSSFRDKWSLGVVTASMVGFLPTEHPGLRVGLFGEAYLNFGLLGVAPLGLLVGAVTRLIDLRVKQSLNLLPDSGVLVYSWVTIGMITSVAVNSTGGSTFYTVMLIFIVSWFARRGARFLYNPTA